MQTVIIVIHLMLVTAMIGLVLLQRSEGGGLGMGSGGGGGFMSSRGTANVLTRATAVVAALFFVTSLTLSVLASIGRKPASILGGPTAPASQPAAPGAPPLTPAGKGLLETLRGQEKPAPAAPAAPAGPQVPQSR
jgi:preprotein translocase subunit SecG